MKRIISILMAIIIVMSSFITVVATPIECSNESDSINSFINSVVELVQKYDKEKEFTVADKDDQSAQIQPFSDDKTANEFADNIEWEYTLQDFQTARLIVRANGNFNVFGALEDISGFEDFHILQYESPEAAMRAYEQYEKEKNIISAAPDEVVSCLQGETSKSAVTDVDPTKDYLCDWSVDRTQSKRLQEYLKTADIPMEEVVVGIVDTGVDYNHEFLKDRVIRTNFNSSSDGIVDDEMDVEKSHGTAVASVIVDNSSQNIKLAVYKVLDNEGYATSSAIASGILKSVENNVDVLNLSIAFSDDELTQAALEKIFEEDIVAVCASGNDGQVVPFFAPSNDSRCINVSASNNNNHVTAFSDRYWTVDISAPGEEITVATINNNYAVFDGTSFSSPCVAALAAIIKSINPNIKSKEIEDTIKSSAYSVRNEWNYNSQIDGVGIVQFCNALNIKDKCAIDCNLTTGSYDSIQTCVLSCEDADAEILYTLDGTYPGKDTALVYDKPFQITEFTILRTVAYYEADDNYSKENEMMIRTRLLGNEEDFIIDDLGVISQYKGNINDLIVPKNINGINVTGFSSEAFKNCNIYGLTLPTTVTKIPDFAFKGHESLAFIEGENVTSIGKSAFEGAEALVYVDFPNAKVIKSSAFKDTFSFCVGNFDSIETVENYAFKNSCIVEFNVPNATVIDGSAFENCAFLERISCPKLITAKSASYWGMFYNTYSLREANFPQLSKLPTNCFTSSNVEKVILPCVKTVGLKCFKDCRNLKYVYMPSLIEMPKDTFNFDTTSYKPITFILDSVKNIDINAFGKCETKRIDFSRLESAKDLPDTENCILAMPSTFTKCTENTKGRNYKVYGTKGTYAEKWANDNGHEFNEISQETALLQDVPMEYTSADEPLTVDVIGFNKTYQWYGNTVADNTTGTPIDGATDKEFNPSDYAAYPYYYCVVASTDVGYEPVEIRTGVTANKEYHHYTVLQHNDTKHWYKCDNCDLTTTPENHYGGTATCTEPKHCELCGVVYGEPLGHTLGEWKTVTPATCTEKGLEKRSCADCDYEETRDIPALGHDLIHHDAKTSTCTEIGWNEYDTCSRCDYSTYNEIPKLGHDYKSTVTPPTCTEKGFTTYTCSRCNDSYVSDYTDTLGHTNGEIIIENKINPTCTTDGSHDEVVYCTVCNAELSRKNIIDEKIGHSFTNYVYNNDATCTADGTETAKCDRCDETDTRTSIGSALGHDLIHHELKTPTCTEFGWKAYDTCKRCDYSTYEKLPLINHTFGEWAVTKEPTETDEGLRERACTICGATETESIPVLPPKPTEPTTEQPNNPDIPNTSDDANVIYIVITVTLATALLTAFGIIVFKKKKAS